jgi:hypothetical protein
LKTECPKFLAGEFNRLLNSVFASMSAVIADPTDTATILVKLSETAIEYYIAKGTQEVYADFDFNGHIETVLLKGERYAHWLRMAFFDATGQSPNREAFKNARDTIEARAFKRGVFHEVHVRIAHHDGKIYLDRNSEERDVIEIDAESCRVLDRSPVKFVRSPDRGVLPIPQPGGCIEDLKQFINLYADAKTKSGNRVKDRDFKLALAVILGCFIEKGEFPYALLFGSHGSSKTTTLKRLCAMVDPILGDPAGSAREDRDVFIIARTTFIQTNDNTKHLSVERQGILCRLTSGGSVHGRSLYTDMNTFSFSVTRPVIATSTIVVVTEEDLSDRMILVRTGLSFTDPDNTQLKRETRTKLDAAFEKAWPRLLGCVLNAVSHGLRNADKEPSEALPRLADIAVWTWRCEPGLGWKQGTILAAWNEMIAEAAEDLAELDPIAAATIAFMSDQPTWQGTMTELLVNLTRKVPVKITKTKDWPTYPPVLSRRLHALSTVLHHNGLVIRRLYDDGGYRLVRISWAERPNGQDPQPPVVEPEVEEPAGDIQL